MKKLYSLFIAFILIFTFSIPSYALVSSSPLGDVLYWDGDTTGLESVNLDGLDFYRVHDNTDFFGVGSISGFCFDTLDSYSSYSELTFMGGDIESFALFAFYSSDNSKQFPVLISFVETDIDGVLIKPGLYFSEFYFSYLLEDSEPFLHRGYITEFRVAGYSGFKTINNPFPDSPDVPENPSTETIIVKENRPFFTTPLNEFSVTEGLLLLIFVTIFLKNIFNQYLKGN